MKFILTAVFLMAVTTSAFAQGHCSMVVKIVDQNDREVTEGVAITVTEQNGRVVRGINQRGGGRFCDLGMLPVTVTVGDPSCHQVSVRNVPLEWGRTKTVKVVDDIQSCRQDPPPVAACQILFRFADEQNKWLSGVSLKPPVSVMETPESDVFGRLRVSIAAGREIRVSAEANGFVPEEIHLTCTRDLMFHERLITLRKRN